MSIFGLTLFLHRFKHLLINTQHAGTRGYLILPLLDHLATQGLLQSK